MATGTPQITPFSWHMAQPSAIETSLAQKVDDPNNPSAIPMLAYYQAQNHINNDNYTAGLADTNAEQVRQAQAIRDNEMRKTVVGVLKDAAQNPGITTALRSAGYLPDGMDTTQLDQSAVDHAGATNIGNFGRGAGALMMAGATGMDTTLQKYVGPGVTQGPSALEKAAAIRASASGGKGKGAADPNTGTEVVTEVLPNGVQRKFTRKGVPVGSDPNVTPRPTGQNTAAARADIAKGMAQGYAPRANPTGGVVYTGASGQTYNMSH